MEIMGDCIFFDDITTARNVISGRSEDPLHNGGH